MNSLESEYYVVQDVGFDNGRIYGGPYHQFTTALKAKNRREREDGITEYKVVEE
jgi:hypothetical protein